MYHIFKTRMVQWHYIYLHAELQSELPSDWYTNYDWWESTPLAGLLPSLTFSIPGDAPFIDNYDTGNQFDLYSERLIAILDKTGVQYETFPVSIIDQETGNTIEHHYRLFHLLEIDLAVDIGKSVIEEDPVGIQVPEIHKLVLTKEFVKKNKPMTRIKEMRNLTIIHEELKHSLEEAKITGCSFTPIEDYSSGLNIFLKKLQNRISAQSR